MRDVAPPCSRTARSRRCASVSAARRTAWSTSSSRRARSRSAGSGRTSTPTRTVVSAGARRSPGSIWLQNTRCTTTTATVGARATGSRSSRLGGTIEETAHFRGVRVSARLDILGDFAGVDAYALPEYQQARADQGLTSVLRKEHYYHAFGGTVRPRLELAYGAFDAGIEARFDSFRAIEHVDVDGELENEVPAADRRTSGRAWLGAKPWKYLRVFVAGERNQRAGSVANVHASRRETGVHLGMELVF